MNPIALILAACCCAALGAQRTWTVDWSGGGDFTDLPEAVAAASPGDTLWVTTQGSYTSTSTSKGVRIVSDSRWSPAGVFTVHDLPADQTFVISGFGDGGVHALSNRFALELRDNRGRVLVDRMRFISPVVTPASTRSYIEIERCAEVALNHCNPFDVSATASTVMITRCGINGNPDQFVATPLEGVALDLVDSRVFVSGSQIVAGFTDFGLEPPVGIRMRGGELTIAGGTADGNWVGGNAAFLYNPPRLGSPIDSSGGVVTIDPDVTLFNTNGTVPPTTGDSTFVFRQVPFTRAFPPQPGGAFDTELYNLPGDLAGLFVSLPSNPIPIAFGELWLDPRFTFSVGSGTLQGTGTEGSLPVSVPLPRGSFPLGMPFSFQGVVLTQGRVELTLPVRVAIRAL